MSFTSTFNSHSVAGWESCPTGSTTGKVIRASIIEVPMVKEDVENLWAPLLRPSVGALSLGLSELLLFGGQNMTHDALEFEVKDQGVETTLTVNFSDEGASHQWGRFTKGRKVKHTTEIDSSVRAIINGLTPRKNYNWAEYNCKEYSKEKYYYLTGVDPDAEQERIENAGIHTYNKTNYGSEFALTTGKVESSKGNLSASVAGPAIGYEFGLIDEENRKMSATVNPQLARAEFSYKGVNVGYGLNAKTGVSARKDGCSVHLLGFGVTLGNGGGISTPFLDIRFGPKHK